jgi:predicted lipoprotein
MTPMRWRTVLSAFTVALAACSKEEPDVPPGTDYRKVALEFAQSLAARDYAKAHAMTSAAYRKQMTVDQLRAAFEAIVPTDWGPIGPIEVGQTLATWPDKQPADLGWAYVSIGGDIASEAIVVVVTAENGAARIRQVEFGRP